MVRVCSFFQWGSVFQWLTKWPPFCQVFQRSGTIGKLNFGWHLFTCLLSTYWHQNVWNFDDLGVQHSNTLWNRDNNFEIDFQRVLFFPTNWDSCFCFSQQTEDEKDLEYAFFGIYDGHGGKEASQYAKVRTQHSVFSHNLNNGHNQCWNGSQLAVISVETVVG